MCRAIRLAAIGKWEKRWKVGKSGGKRPKAQGLANCHSHNNEMRKLCDFHICTAFEIKRMKRLGGRINHTPYAASAPNEMADQHQGS